MEYIEAIEKDIDSVDVKKQNCSNDRLMLNDMRIIGRW